MNTIALHTFVHSDVNVHTAISACTRLLPEFLLPHQWRGSGGEPHYSVSSHLDILPDSQFLYVIHMLGNNEELE